MRTETPHEAHSPRTQVAGFWPILDTPMLPRDRACGPRRFCCRHPMSLGSEPAPNVGWYDILI